MSTEDRRKAIDRARIEDDVYLERPRGLREAKESLERTTTEGISVDRAVAWLQTVSATWTEADVPEAKAELLHAICERIVIEGPRFVGLRLTPAAYAHGLAVAMPDKVALRARQESN
jgi:hypothetical protein